MTHRLVVREGGPEDSDTILEIQRKAALAQCPRQPGAPETGQQIREQMRGFQDREAYLVLERDGEMIGWCLIQLYSDRPGYRFCCESSVCLDPSQARPGDSSVLMDALMERCRQYEYHHLLAKVFTSDLKGIEFHRRFGYQIVGTQRSICYRDGQWLDVVIMQLILPKRSGSQLEN